MSITTRPLIATLLSSLLLMTASSAQTVKEEANTQGIIMSFDTGIRARNRLAPTPQFTALVPGLYARRILQTASVRGDYTVQIWALLVSPHVDTGEARLPGAVVLSVRTGSVELISGETKTTLKAGATAAVPENASVRFVNSDTTRPAQLRAIVLSGTGQPLGTHDGPRP